MLDLKRWLTDDLRALALLTACLLSTNAWAAPTDTATASTVIVSGAREGGVYDKLIAKFNKAGLHFTERCNVCEGSDCEQLCSEQLSFEHCPSRGSIHNLERLGMQPEPKLEQTRENIGAEKPETDCGAQVHFAIVQDYFAYEATQEASEGSIKGGIDGYEPFNELRSVLPLYTGYVQIVSAIEEPGQEQADSKQADSKPIRTLSDLEGKKVYVGKRGSVNYYHAKAIFERHHKLFEGVGDFIFECEPEQKPPSCIPSYPARPADKTAEEWFTPKQWRERFLCSAAIDAYVASAQPIKPGPIEKSANIDAYLAANPIIGLETPPSCGEEKFRIQQIPVDEVILEGLAKQRPYYKRQTAPGSLLTAAEREAGEERQVLAVTTFLASAETVPNELVKRATTQLYQQWAIIRQLDSKLPPIDSNVLRSPTKLHDGAQEALQELDVIGQPNLYVWGGIGMFIAGLVFLIPRVSYDRMGMRRREDRWLNWFAWTSLIGKLVVVVSATVVVLVIAIWCVMWLETAVATSRNVDNALLRFDFLDAVAWIFTFIASGYESDVFPLSNVARVGVAFLAFIGLGLPLWFILNVVSEHAERILDRDRGLHDHRRIKGHTLVCGWNEKAPGIIYTLTCFQSPHREKVVIVADMDAEYPVKQWKFHKGRVKFCRGDASMGRVLRRAKAHLASNAIVLASDDDADRSGVLTALAVRKLNPTAFITAELAQESDADYFASSNVNKVVDPDYVSHSMLTLACWSEEAMDFVLDALSPDERAEWYSMHATRLEPLLSIDNRPSTIKTCIEILSEFNINVIGIASAEPMGSDQELFVDGTYIDPLYRQQSLDKPLPSNCHVICAARNNWSFRLARLRYVLSRAANLVPGITTRPGSVVRTTDSSISPSEPLDHRVLIVGSRDQGTKLAEFMKRGIGRTADVLIIDGKETLEDVEQQVSELHRDQPWTHVVIMALQLEANARNNSSRIDAQTILRTHLIQSALAKEGVNPILVAEILNVDNRQMFEEAQIDVVVPTMITMERILARMAAGQGLVSTMLTSLISREDGIFLDSIQLPRKHPLVGQRFGDAITNYFEDGRVLAVLPMSQRKRLENECDDFRTHFVMCPQRQPVILAAGDVVILLRHA